MREAAAPQDSAGTANKTRNNEINRQQSASVSGDALTRDAMRLVDSKAVNETQVTQSARTERLSAQARAVAETEATPKTGTGAAPASKSGNVEFDMENGQRVTKVFDNKNILIYQIPGKGTLQLIEAQESAQQRQVQTVA